MGRKSPKPDPALPRVVTAAAKTAGRRPPPPETPEPRAPRNPPPPDTPEEGTEADMQPRTDRVCNECGHPNDRQNDVRAVNARTQRNNPYCQRCNQCTGLAPARAAKPSPPPVVAEAGQQAGDFEDAPRAPALAPADEFDGKTPLPRLEAIRTNAADHKLVERLAAVLAANPKLLKPAGLPGEPRWDVVCPDKAVLDVGGYGPDGAGPVRATRLEVVGYTPGGKGASGYAGSAMPATRVFKSVRLLLEQHEPEKAPAPRARPPAAIAPPPKIAAADDDFFGV